MADTKVVKVKNRSASSVVYKVPDLGIRREFNPGEIKKISIEELEKLSYVQGGTSILRNFLQILDNPAVKDDITGPTELEYDWSEQDVIDLIKNGSLDSFLDALDFAPAGVIDLIKKYAVSLPMADLNKIKALKTKTGLDVAAAITLEQADEAPKPVEKKRRAATTTSTRRTQ